MVVVTSGRKYIDILERYFKECKLEIEKNLRLSIENINSILPPIFAQLTVYNKETILKDKQIINETLNNIGTNWLLNLICLKDGKSYLIAENIEGQDNIEKLFHKKFENEIMELESVYLRKEIIKLGLNRSD